MVRLGSWGLLAVKISIPSPEQVTTRVAELETERSPGSCKNFMALDF